MPMLPGDESSAWDPSVISDPRVTQLWDGDRIVGRWLADHQIGGLDRPGGIVWDAFFGFGPSARWQRVPSDLVTAGSTIIGNTGALQHDFVSVLAR
jgi:hypothetical protein